MTSILGILQFIVISYICIYELKKKSMSVFLWAVLLIMFGIPHMFVIISGTYKYSTSTMNESSIFVILFSITYLITKYIVNSTKKKTIKEKKILSENEKYYMKKFMNILFVILIVIVCIRIVTLSKQAGGIFNTSWATLRRASTGKYFSFSQIFIPVFFASSSCIILAIEMKDKKILIMSMLLVIVEVIISRNRIEVLPVFVAVICSYILNLKRISIKKILILGLIGIVSIYLVYALRVFRHSGSIKKFIQNYNIKTFNEKVMSYLENDDGELGLREYMYYFIENNNDFQDFGKGHTYIRMLMVFIPSRWSFELKPSDFAISMGKAVFPDIKGFSVHPTLFGDVYANFGFYGFVWGIVWAIFTKIIDQIIEKRKRVFLYPFSFIFGIAYIIEARGSVYNAFTWSLFSILLIVFTYLIFKFINNSNNKKEYILLNSKSEL